MVKFKDVLGQNFNLWNNLYSGMDGVGLNSTTSNYLCRIFFCQAVLGQNFSNILVETKRRRNKSMDSDYYQDTYGTTCHGASQNRTTDRTEQLCFKI
jgi:hypothetical protein